MSDALPEPPACQGPNPFVSPPGFAVPANACDTHAHVIGPADRFPMVANRSYTPPPAPEAAYLGMLDSLGMRRGVLVQISIYGTDNRCMLESLKRHPDRLRGVAVLAPDVTDAELAELHCAAACAACASMCSSAAAWGSRRWNGLRPASHRSVGTSSCCSMPAPCLRSAP